MTLNEAKLTAMVEAVMKSNPIDFVRYSGECNHYLNEETLRTALAPFFMEMTDEEISKRASQEFTLNNIESSACRGAFTMGAKFYRDR